ncbi:MAG: glycosyltransferase [bacterium]|nr:glycosyltransferase [bacterium]
MKVLYFGFYNPEYSRNRVLIKGLHQNGVEVAECRVVYKSIWSYAVLFFKYLSIRWDFDVMIVGFPGQEVMFLARVLTGKPIIFDAFTSHYEGYIQDRALYGTDSLHAKFYRWLDSNSCRLADVVLLDTNTHIDYFIKEFRLPKQKFRRIFVGTDSALFYPSGKKNDGDKFKVHFHGHYIPLQGVEYIIRAINILKNEDIEFVLIGRGQTYAHNRQLVDGLGIKNIEFVESVSYQELADRVRTADICLGIFGHTAKAQRVIPNKLFEAIACAKPVITARSPAIAELLTDGEDVILCNVADSEDLAKKILDTKSNKAITGLVGSNGLNLFRSKLETNILGKELKGIINEII